MLRGQTHICETQGLLNCLKFRGISGYFVPAWPGFRTPGVQTAAARGLSLMPAAHLDGCGTEGLLSAGFGRQQQRVLSNSQGLKTPEML